jgi:hypothetical protein
VQTNDFQSNKPSNEGFSRVFQTLNIRALWIALLSTGLLILAVIIGSRQLQNFDAALVAYLFGSIFAFFGVVYRYAVWLQRPPTLLYWKRGWQLFFTGKTIVLGWAFLVHFVNDIVIHKFIFARGKQRWAGHMLLVLGCISAFAVTFPLTFGWVHFALKQDTTNIYVAHVFGFAVFEFPLHSMISYFIFHLLDWSSFAVIAGITIIFRRRLINAGLMAVQTFENDWLPLILLLAISITGLGLTLDYEFMQGKAHQFMAITHAITVILFLIWMPFGKFFHIFQRPAQLGIAIYRKQGQMGEQAVCPHTKKAFASQLHVGDLKQVTQELGFDYTLKDGSSHLDLSPEGKRAALARAHLQARKKQFFG